MFFEDSVSAEPSRVSPRRADPAPENGLTEIQRRILSAAREGGPIYVYLDGPGQGEVKSGTERFFGDDAVKALATLVAPGLVAATEKDCFELTSNGHKLAGLLS